MHVAVGSHTSELRSRLAAILSRGRKGVSEDVDLAEDGCRSPLRTSAQAAPVHGDGSHGSPSVALAHGGAIVIHAEVEGGHSSEGRRGEMKEEDSAPRKQRSDMSELGTTVEHEAARRRRIEKLDDLVGRMDMLEWRVLGEQYSDWLPTFDLVLILRAVILRRFVR